MEMWILEYICTQHLILTQLYRLLLLIKKSGDYIGYANAFIEESRKFAYLEPLCVIPQYRKNVSQKQLFLK